MEGKTKKRFDGLFRDLRRLQIVRKAPRLGAAAITFLLLISLIVNGVFPRTILGEAGSASATRLWSSGAELNTLTANVEITGSAGTVSVSSSTKRSGDYAFRANPTSSTGTIYKTWANSAQSNKFWFRQYIRIATAPGADTYIMQIGNGSSGKISVRMSSSSTLQLRNEEDNANIGSASSALSTNTWYRLEVYINTTTLSTTTATMLLDGTQISTSSSENLAAGVDRWTWGVANSTTADLFFDDLAVNNSSGRSTDNWPGEGNIVHMQPDADGDNTAWGGYPSDTNDYDDVDEVTPNDSTDFIRSTTQNQLDDVNLESSSNAGISAGDYIKLVSVGARFGICGAVIPEPACSIGNGDVNYKTRIKASASGTTEESASTGIDDLIGGYVTNNDDTARLNALTIYDLPGSSTTQWTTTNLDSAQIGIRNDDPNGTGFKMTAIWLQVEYVSLTGGRLISSGLELNSATAGVEVTAVTNSPSINSSTVRSGAYSLETENGGGQEYVRYYFESSNTNGDYYGRAYFRISTAVDIFDATIMSFLDTSNLQRAAIKITSSNTLKLFDEDSQVGSASSALSTGTWYRIELRIDTTGSSGSHIVDGRIDGTSFASSTTRSIGTGVARLGIGINASDNSEVSNNQGGFIWDDIAVNKGIGTNQNTWPGDGKIIHLRPNTAGSAANWTTNGTCTGGNYACVDEVTPNDATNYVSETTSDDIDEYNITDSSIGASDTVNLVSVGVRFSTSSATQEDFKVRLKESSSGIAIESTILSPDSTTWTTNGTADPKLYPLTAYTRPEMASAWTDTQLDSAQIGVRDVLSSSGTVRVTALWLLIDYTVSPPINISGTCDQYDQTTDCTDDGANEIAVAVNGSLQAQVDTTVDGSWQISSVNKPNSGDIITVFINGETTDSEEAVAVTKYDGSGDITGVVLFHRHLTIGSADNQTLSNTDLGSYDNSVSSDEDIFFDVSAGDDLTVDSLGSYTDEELYIVTGNTFRPASGGGADVTTVHVENDGTWIADSNAINVSGSWQNDGTFTAGTSTATFNSTTTGRTLSGTLSGSTGKFNHLVFNGSGGGWTLGANTETENDFTVSLGTFSTSGTNYSLTVGRDFTLANSASVTFTANGSTISVGRHWDKGNSSSFSRGASTVNLTGTGEIKSTGGGFTQFHNLGVASTSQTTTMTIARTDVYNTLTVNAGIMTCSVTCEFELFRTSGSDLSIDGSATLSGSNATFHLRKQSASTISIASGNYGTWNILLRADTASTVTFNLSGNVTTTGTVLVWAASGGAGSNFNTQNFNLTAKSFSTGHSSNTTAIASNFGSSTVTLENGTSNALFPVSNGGSHSLNLSSADINIKGNVRFVNGTGTFTVTEGTSTLTWTNTSGTVSYAPNGQSLYNMVLNAAGGTLTPTAAVDVNNNFTITNGVYDTVNGSNYSLTVDNNFTGTSGTWTFQARAATITVSGNWDTSAIGADDASFVRGTSTVVMNGTGTKTITTGSTNVWQHRFYNLTVGQSGNTTRMMQTFGVENQINLGTGTFDLNSRLLYNSGTNANFLNLNPSGTWGTGNGAYAPYGSNNKNIPAFTYNSGLQTEQNTGFKTIFQGNASFTSFLIGCCSRASEIDINGYTVTVTGNVTFGTTTAILTLGSGTLNVGGNWVNTNNAVLNANTGTVVLNGTSTQTLSGLMTGSSSFYNLTITNSSGTNASDCERTGFVAGIDFAASATVTNNTVFTTASSRIEFNSGSTYTLTNINWNGQAVGTRLYFRNSAVSGSWNLNVSGTQTAVSYVNVSRSNASSGNTIMANDGTNFDCGNNVNWNFSNPDAPSDLAQKKTNDTVIATGGWTNETSVKFTATASDTDSSDTLYLCVEKDLLGTGFSNTEDLCGTGVAYSGTPVTVTVTISGITDVSEYHWQARVKDQGGVYGSWVSYGGNAESARDFGVDTTACTYAGTIYDGLVEDVDAAFNDGSLEELTANWDAFSCGASGLLRYDVSIGTTAGGTDILTWTNNGTNEDTTQAGLSLHTNQRYYVNVRAIDNASNTSSVHSSNGQDVLPTISLTLGSTTVTFSNLNDGNNRTDSKTLNLTTSTNAYGGYVIRQYATGLLTNGSFTIPMFQGGTYASPGSWPGGFCTGGSNCGYGYTSNDTTIQGSNKFSSGTLYASFATAAFGDIVADHTDAVTGATGPVTNEVFTITHKVAVDALQAAKNYQTEVLYIVTGTF